LSKGSGDTAEMGSMKCTKTFSKEILNWSYLSDEKKIWKNVKMW
jgi:hypothetical protein